MIYRSESGDISMLMAGETMLSLAPGARRFRETGRRAGWIVQMAQAPDGTVWTGGGVVTCVTGTVAL